ncbi:M48 family metalloprotease [Streptomyces sp. NPDC088719]|uniref:M48 family metalloprotease n=1 Tax=Streptomyces sp. NPDC088719 TaxID=3365872 RepID=UPI0038093A01
MSAADLPGTSRNRLPASLVSGTTLRFVLLAAIPSAFMMSLADNVADVLQPVSDAAVAAYERCQTEQYRQIGKVNWANVDQPTALPECGSPPHNFAGWSLVALVMFWVAMGLAVWWLPAWRIRRRRYEEIGRVVPSRIASDGALPGGGDLLALLARLQLGTDVAVPVTYLLDPLDPRCSALAFGRPGRRFIVLSGGLETLSRGDPVAFRVVLLHELAHIHNRDLDRGFLTIVMWRFFMPLLVFNILTNPLLVPGFQGATPHSALVAYAFADSALQIVLAVTAPLLRNSVLRSRELFADAQVYRWGVDVAHTDAMLATYFPSIRRRWPEVLRVHPSPQRRRAVLHDSRLLGTTSVWDWGAVGLGAVILHWSVLGSWPGGSLIVQGVGIAAAGVFITVAVWAATWQDTVREGAPQWQVPGRRAVGVGLGLGLAVGSSLFPTTVAAFFHVGDSVWGQFFAWLPLMLLFAWAVRRWLGAVVAEWADAVGAREGWAAKRVLWTVLGVASVLVSVGLAYLSLGRWVATYMPMLGGEAGAFSGFATLVALPVLFAFFPALALPMLLAGAVLPLAGSGSASLGQALRKGLWCGLVAAVPAICLTVYGARAGMVIAVVMLVQVGCAVNVARTTDRRGHPLPVAAAIVAAFVAGVVGNLNCLAVGAWYSVALGVTLGVIVGSVSAAVALGIRRRRAQRAGAGRPRIHKPSAANGPSPSQGPWKLTWGRRTGLWYGVGAALTAVLLVPFGSLHVVWGVVVLAQAVCATRVALTVGRQPRPVAAAAYAALAAGLIGYLGFFAILAAVTLPSLASTRSDYSWGAIAMGLTFVVGVAVGFGVAVGGVSASVALGVHRRRAQRSSVQ